MHEKPPRGSFARALAALAFGIGSTASACELEILSEGLWSWSGPHQGYMVSAISNGPHNFIYVSCDFANGHGSGLRVCLNGREPPGATLKITIDSNQPIFFTLNRPGNGGYEFKGGQSPRYDFEFENLIAELRGGSTVRIEDGLGAVATFPLKGSAKALDGCKAVM